MKKKPNAWTLKTLLHSNHGNAAVWAVSVSGSFTSSKCANFMCDGKSKMELKWKDTDIHGKSVARSTQRSLEKFLVFPKIAKWANNYVYGKQFSFATRKQANSNEKERVRGSGTCSEFYRNSFAVRERLRAKNNNKWNVWLCSCMLCSVYFCVHFQRKILNLLITHTHLQFPSTMCHSWLSGWVCVSTRRVHVECDSMNNAAVAALSHLIHVSHSQRTIVRCTELMW